uniref:Uncharacterized protein n=1 Tax=Thermosphaera aggregans TaxID=54254 RepID=A0A7C2BLE4_9CREN
MPRVLKNSLLVEAFSLETEGFTSFLEDLSENGIEEFYVARRPGYTYVIVDGEVAQVAVAPFTLVFPPESSDQARAVAEKYGLQYYVNHKDTWMEHSLVNASSLARALRSLLSIREHGLLKTSGWLITVSRSRLGCEKLVAVNQVYTSLGGLVGHHDFSDPVVKEAVEAGRMGRCTPVIIALRPGGAEPVVQACFEEREMVVKAPGPGECPGFWRIIHWLLMDVSTGPPD